MSDSRSPCQNSKLVQYKTARVRTGTSQTELLIDLLVRARGTPALETELLEDKVNSGSLHNNDQITHLMTVLLPTEGLGEHKTPSAGEHEASKKKGPYVESLNGEDGSSTPQDAELVLLRLGIEDRPARQTDNTGLDTLSVEFGSRGGSELPSCCFPPASGLDNGSLRVRLKNIEGQTLVKNQ